MIVKNDQNVVKTFIEVIKLAVTTVHFLVTICLFFKHSFLMFKIKCKESTVDCGYIVRFSLSMSYPEFR